MTPADLTPTELARSLARPGLTLALGPFSVRLRTRIASVVDGLHRLYAEYPVVESPDYADFHVSMVAAGGLRRWYRPQVHFVADGRRPFKPLPLAQAFAMFEWGMNWSVSSTAHQFLILHAAVLEKGGGAILMPAPPGSGKSTLCAGLHARGWRLLSDEMALIDPQSLRVHPIPRPISLKNASIPLVRRLFPDLVLGPVASDTLKGTVSHVRPLADSIERQRESAPIRSIVFPRYEPGSAVVAEARPRSEALIEMAENGFNYNALGGRGFDALRRLVSEVDSVDLDYADLAEAVAYFDRLAEHWQMAA